jgi:hypothetical protein
MKRQLAIAVILMALVAAAGAGCSDNPKPPPERFLAEMNPGNIPGPAQVIFTILLNTDEANSTSYAIGTATLTVEKADVMFRIELLDIATTVDQVSLHTGAPEATGPEVAQFNDNPISGPFDLRVLEGTLTGNDLSGISFDDLVDALRAGGAYILVTTQAWPDGELRGQSTATGEVRFLLDGSTMAFSIDAYAISDLRSVSIYSGGPGQSGSPLVTLYTSDETVALNGRVADGSFGEDDIVEGMSFDELLTEMRAGRTNVLAITEGKPLGAMRGEIVSLYSF